MAVVEIIDLHAGYSGKEVLRGVSFTAEQGQITAVIGPNGCGKSTLLKAISGIIPVTAGEALLGGEDLLQLPQGERAKKIAYLAQNRQTPDITVGRLVLHGRFPYLSYPRRYRQADRQIAESMMEKLDVRELADCPMGTLSGGQQQKAYIAMALTQDSDTILLDEPTTYLDVAYQLQVLELAQLLAASGKHVIMVIHDISHAMEFAQQVVLMDAGSVVAQGTPEQIYSSAKLDAVFGIRIQRVETEEGWHYFGRSHGK